MMIPTTGIPEILRLKRVLWRGTLTLDLVFLIVTALFWPTLLKPAFMGVLLGLGYLWSLFFNAEHPKRKIQFAFSLMRIVILAYAIVSVSHARVPELAIVICGFLSYKVVLTVDAAAQVVSGLRRQAAGRTRPSGNSLNTGAPSSQSA